jgi:hypothetical protein
MITVMAMMLIKTDTQNWNLLVPAMLLKLKSQQRKLTLSGIASRLGKLHSGAFLPLGNQPPTSNAIGDFAASLWWDRAKPVGLYSGSAIGGGSRISILSSR